MGGLGAAHYRILFVIDGMAGLSFAVWDYHSDPDDRITRETGGKALSFRRVLVFWQDSHPSSFNHQAILAEKPYCLGKAAMLQGKDARSKHLLVILFLHLHAGLDNHRAGIHTLIDEMYGAA